MQSASKIGRIKIIQCDSKDNNPTPTYSNTANTTYYSYNKKTGRIEHIYYYKNHKHNTHSLSDRDKRLMNNALKWNKEHEK